MNVRKSGFSTRAIHSGYDPYAGPGALTPPIHLSSTYTFPSAAEGGMRFAGQQEGYVYGRIAQPTASLLETRLADLEGAEAALVTSSGMGAICSLLWTLLRPGDELLTDQTLYGCTFAFFHHALEEFGVRVRHVDLLRPEALAAEITPKTRGVYYETIANPNMRVVDIAAVSEIAQAAGIWTVADNTYLSPYLCRPIELGADFVVHSATKYLSGHGDVLAGVIAGREEALRRVRLSGVKDMTGACLGGFDAYLVLRGLKTLPLRMERHSQSALAVAQWLQSHPAIRQVAYPGLEHDPGHSTLQRQATAAAGVLAFELQGGTTAALEFLDRLSLIVRAVSLGDAETIVQHPASMTHSTYTPEERQRHGISDGLLRLSVGLEDVEDVLNDLEQALCGLAGG